MNKFIEIVIENVRELGGAVAVIAFCLFIFCLPVILLVIAVNLFS